MQITIVKPSFQFTGHVYLFEFRSLGNRKEKGKKSKGEGGVGETENRE
jgi:hypothetical protein